MNNYTLTKEEFETILFYNKDLNREAKERFKEEENLWEIEYCIVRVDPEGSRDYQIYFKIQVGQTTPKTSMNMYHFNTYIPIKSINKTLANFIIDYYDWEDFYYCSYNNIIKFKVLNSIIESDPDIKYKILIGNNKELRNLIKEKYF
jgi:hypothetical protein